MEIKLGFSNSNTLVSKAIRWLTRSKISHTMLYVKENVEGTEVEFVLEAGPTGFVYLPYEAWAHKNTLVYLIEPVVPLDNGLKAAEKWIGEPYAYGKLIGFLWVLVGRRLRRRWHNPIGQHRALFCSEANTHVIQESGWPGSEKLDASATDPQDLLTFVSGGNL